MSNARDGFDAIGVVVDWIDACKQRRLDDLLDLYDVTATVEFCEGGSFRGRSEMESYWAPRLARSRRGASFSLSWLILATNCRFDPEMSVVR